MVRTLVFLDEFVCWKPRGESFTIPNNRTCDGIADCPVPPWSNTSDDENKYTCHDPESKSFFSVKTNSSLIIKIRLNIRDQNLHICWRKLFISSRSHCKKIRKLRLLVILRDQTKSECNDP